MDEQPQIKEILDDMLYDILGRHTEECTITEILDFLDDSIENGINAFESFVQRKD
jgi:hypothetical protein